MQHQPSCTWNISEVRWLACRCHHRMVYQKFMKMKDCCATNAIMRWRWCPLVVCSCARRATAAYGEVLKTLDFKAKTTCQQGDKQKQCKTSTRSTRKHCTISCGYDETEDNYVLMNCILIFIIAIHHYLSSRLHFLYFQYMHHRDFFFNISLSLIYC